MNVQAPIVQAPRRPGPRPRATCRPGRVWPQRQRRPGRGPRPRCGPADGQAARRQPRFDSQQAADPGALLDLLRSAGTVTDEGPASGPGWTGTRYGFTVATSGRASGGRHRLRRPPGTGRRLCDDDHDPPWGGYHVTITEDVTFSDFSVPVSVTAPASRLRVPATWSDLIPLARRRALKPQAACSPRARRSAASRIHSRRPGGPRAELGRAQPALRGRSRRPPRGPPRC